MFGHLDYVAEIPECNRYRCSLCHELGREYGLLARFLTNYDVSLCALVVLDPSVDNHAFHTPSCPMFSRHEVFQGKVSVFEFLAAVTIVLAAEKVKDDAYDEGQPPASLAFRWMKKRREQAEAVLRGNGFDPEIMTHAFDEQRLLEKSRSRNLRDYARPIAEVMGAVYARAAELAGRSDTTSYRVIGQALGEIVYFCDSVTDYSDDLRNNRFTPFVTCERTPAHSVALPASIRDEVHSLLSESFERIRNALEQTAHSSIVHELLVNRLQGKIREISAYTEDVKSVAPSSSILSRFGELSPLTLVFFPRLAFAANGRTSSDSCIEALLPLGIMLFAMNAVMKKCFGQGICGSGRPDRVTVEDSCGGRKTYTRDRCSGKYKQDGC